MPADRFWILIAKKLNHEASEDELKELQEWYGHNTENDFSIHQLQQLWSKKKQPVGAEAVEAQFAKQLQLIKKADSNSEIASSYASKRTIKRSRQVAVFSVLLLLLVAAVALVQHNNRPVTEYAAAVKINEVSTKPASRSQLILPDGSTVWLNADSKLTYSNEFGKGERSVNLSGEAYFDVKKSVVPFVIRTTDMQIKVLGTAFNVKCYPADVQTETTVVRGKVEVTTTARPGEKFILKPADKITINRTGTTNATDKETPAPIIVLGRASVTDEHQMDELAWKEARLKFENESFKMVANQMERWYGVQIIFADAALAATRLTGSFENESLTDALAALQLTTPFRYTSENNKVTLYKK